MKGGKVYCLTYEDVPFYIGQTKDKLIKRLDNHFYSSFQSNNKYYLYEHIRLICDYDYNNFEKISICFLDSCCGFTCSDCYNKKVSNKCVVNDIEFEWISKCIDIKLPIYNSCSKTIKYIKEKWSKDIIDYNYDNRLNKITYKNLQFLKCIDDGIVKKNNEF